MRRRPLPSSSRNGVRAQRRTTYPGSMPRRRSSSETMEKETTGSSASSRLSATGEAWIPDTRRLASLDGAFRDDEGEGNGLQPLVISARPDSASPRDTSFRGRAAEPGIQSGDRGGNARGSCPAIGRRRAGIRVPPRGPGMTPMREFARLPACSRPNPTELLTKARGAGGDEDPRAPSQRFAPTPSPSRTRPGHLSPRRGARISARAAQDRAKTSARSTRRSRKSWARRESQRASG